MSGFSLANSRKSGPLLHAEGIVVHVHRTAREANKGRSKPDGYGATSAHCQRRGTVVRLSECAPCLNLGDIHGYDADVRELTVLGALVVPTFSGGNVSNAG